MVRNIFIVITVFTLLASCKSEKTENMLLKVQAMQASVDSSNKVFQTIDTNVVSTAKIKSEKQLEFLKEHYNDTNYQNARYIDVYNSNFKLMRKLLKGYNRLHSEIEFSNSQLNHLQNDINNGFANDNEYKKHLAGEQKAVEKIRVSTRVLKEWEAKTVKRYNGMNMSIDSIVTELHNQGRR